MSSFLLANVFIDVEVLWYLWHRDPPLHRLSHTYVAGLLFGLLAGGVTWVGLSRFVRSTPAKSRRLRAAALGDSVLGGVIGGLSHVLLDSLLYRDMKPLWPLDLGNSLAGTVGNGLLHGICAGIGLLGVALWWIQRDAAQ